MRNVIKYLFKLYLIVIFLQTVSVQSEPGLTVDGFEWDHIMTQDIIPDTSNSYDIGSLAFPIAELHVSTGSVFLGANEITAVGSAVGDLLYNGQSLSSGGGSLPTVFYLETNTLYTALANGILAPIEHLIFSNVPPADYKYHINSRIVQAAENREDRFALRIDGIELPLTGRTMQMIADDTVILSLYGVISVTGITDVVIDVTREGIAGSGTTEFTNRNFSLQEVTLGTF